MRGSPPRMKTPVSQTQHCRARYYLALDELTARSTRTTYAADYFHSRRSKSSTVRDAYSSADGLHRSFLIFLQQALLIHEGGMKSVRKFFCILVMTLLFVLSNVLHVQDFYWETTVTVAPRGDLLRKCITVYFPQHSHRNSDGIHFQISRPLFAVPKYTRHHPTVEPF